jgi:hypothetical protein
MKVNSKYRDQINQFCEVITIESQKEWKEFCKDFKLKENRKYPPGIYVLYYIYFDHVMTYRLSYHYTDFGLMQGHICGIEIMDIFVSFN